MLKSKFKFIAIFTIIVLLFTVPIVRADNETEENTNTNTNSEVTDAPTDERRWNSNSNNY